MDYATIKDMINKESDYNTKYIQLKVLEALSENGDNLEDALKFSTGGQLLAYTRYGLKVEDALKFVHGDSVNCYNLDRNMEEALKCTDGYSMFAYRYAKKFAPEHIEAAFQVHSFKSLDEFYKIAKPGYLTSLNNIARDLSDKCGEVAESMEQIYQTYFADYMENVKEVISDYIF